MDTEGYTKAIQTAYDAVKGATIDDQYKTVAFKLVLGSVLHTDTKQGSAQTKGRTIATGTPGDWTATIADKLSVSPGQVESLYYYDEGAKSLRLLIDHKKLPKSLSGSTQHIAALLAAGRQALKLDDAGTDYELIRQAAKDYGVFNSSNFTAYVKALGPRFMIRGSGQNQSIQLTLPAYAIAADFAKLYVEAE